MKKILVFVGTRPEAIKLAPVIIALRERSDAFDVKVCASGQHREMLAQALDDFGIGVDIALQVMVHNQTLGGLTARLFEAIDPVIDEVSPDWVVVQGDTTTVMVAAMLAFYHGVQVAHVEAGLRTSDLRHPFPEEMNRRVAAVVAARHYAPTDAAMQNLLAEGLSSDQVKVTGNTVVDALLLMRDKVRTQMPALPPLLDEALQAHSRLLLITGHRRENFGDGFEQLCGAIGELAQAHPDVVFVYPVHLNPNVREPVQRLLSDYANVVLCEPLPYPQIVHLMDRAQAILTDSGGIQEEGITLGRPVLVTREVTERPEGMHTGLMQLVGTDRERIIQAVNEALARTVERDAICDIYGDGKAAQRIVEDLLKA